MGGGDVGSGLITVNLVSEMLSSLAFSQGKMSVPKMHVLLSSRGNTGFHGGDGK